PYVPRGMDAVHDWTLATMTEQPVQRMCDNCQATLFVDQIDAALHAQARRDALLDKEYQQVSLFSAYLFAYDEVETISALLPDIAGTQRTLDHIVIGNGDYIQGRVFLCVIENFLNAAAAIAISTMHMNVRSTRFACVICLLGGHLLPSLQR